MLGRKCPSRKCGKYFKIKPGTGLTGKDLPCRCPYCGFTGPTSRFNTADQIDFAKAAALTQISREIHDSLKGLEFEQKPTGPFGIGLSVKVTGRPQTYRHYYREKELETDVVCDQCTLAYAIYGAFAFCPDCGSHNSFNILSKNLDLAEKLLMLAVGQDRVLAEHLVGDALENVVSAFDGFGREICRAAAPKASNPADAVRFQNLVGACGRVQKLFAFDMMTAVSVQDWDFACKCFQKRHLLAHKLGVIDDNYVQATKDPAAMVGRKVRIESQEVKRLSEIVRQLGAKLTSQLLPPQPTNKPTAET